MKAWKIFKRYDKTFVFIKINHKEVTTPKLKKHLHIYLHNYFREADKLQIMF